MEKKKWWEYLLAIPAVFIVDIAMFVVALYIDGQIFSDSNNVGHGVPFISLIMIFLIIAITLIVLIKTIINIVKSFNKNDEKEIVKTKESKLKTFIPLLISMLISFILIVISFNTEINNFYNDPNHIGFALPIFSFMLTGILFIANIIILIVTLVIVKKKSNNN